MSTARTRSLFKELKIAILVTGLVFTMACGKPAGSRPDPESVHPQTHKAESIQGRPTTSTSYYKEVPKEERQIGKGKDLVELGELSITKSESSYSEETKSVHLTADGTIQGKTIAFDLFGAVDTTEGSAMLLPTNLNEGFPTRARATCLDQIGEKWSCTSMFVDVYVRINEKTYSDQICFQNGSAKSCKSEDFAESSDAGGAVGDDPDVSEPGTEGTDFVPGKENRFTGFPDQVDELFKMTTPKTWSEEPKQPVTSPNDTTSGKPAPPSDEQIPKTPVKDTTPAAPKSKPATPKKDPTPKLERKTTSGTAVPKSTPKPTPKPKANELPKGKSPRRPAPKDADKTPPQPKAKAKAKVVEKAPAKPKVETEKAPEPEKEAPAGSVKPTKDESPPPDEAAPSSRGALDVGDNARRDGQATGGHNRGRLINASALNPRSTLYQVLTPNRKTYFGTALMIQFIERLAKAARELIPNFRLQIKDVSRENGGPLGSHGSHQNGLDADIGYLMKNPSSTNLRSIVRGGVLISDFKASAQWSLFERAGRTKVVKFIFVDKPIKQAFCRYARANGGLEKYKQGLRFTWFDPRSPGHDDHWHLRLKKCRNDNPRCQEPNSPPDKDGCNRVGA